MKSSFPRLKLHSIGTTPSGAALGNEPFISVVRLPICGQESKCPTAVGRIVLQITRGIMQLNALSNAESPITLGPMASWSGSWKRTFYQRSSTSDLRSREQMSDSRRSNYADKRFV